MLFRIMVVIESGPRLTIFNICCFYETEKCAILLMDKQILHLQGELNRRKLL